MKCPVCNSELEIKEKIVTVPHFGKVRIISLNCPKCGWHRADTHLVEKENPKEFEFETSKENLNKLLVKFTIIS